MKPADDLARQGEAVDRLQKVSIFTDDGQASPQVLLMFNRQHWGIEIMHRHKDVTLGEDGYTNRNVFTILCFVFKILKSVSSSPTRAIERFQDDRNRAIRLFACFH